MSGLTRLTRVFMEDTMLHGSWFLPQQQFVPRDGGKNRGEAKAEKRRRQRLFSCQSEAAKRGAGVPPAARPCKPHRGARSSALYRPDNRMSGRYDG
ncbi:MAG: hypothetical protein QMD10_10755 [Desulfitobacteriaceae bacterium]|nr:hypothetical protein [Desulfitobacteriaceae bacterium]